MRTRKKVLKNHLDIITMNAIWKRCFKKHLDIVKMNANWKKMF